MKFDQLRIQSLAIDKKILTSTKIAATTKEHVEEFLWRDFGLEPMHSVHSTTTKSMHACGLRPIVVHARAFSILGSMLIKNGALLGVAKNCKGLRDDYSNIKKKSLMFGSDNVHFAVSTPIISRVHRSR